MSEPQSLSRSISASSASETAIQETRNQLLANPALSSAVVIAGSNTWAIPFVALLVDETALRSLIASSQIIGISEDGDVGSPRSPIAPPLIGNASGPRIQLINAQAAWDRGFDGNEWTIAILDSGVDNTNPFLSGKVIDGLCTSSSNPGDTSLCPQSGGSLIRTGISAGSPDTCLQLTASSEQLRRHCYHGTQVAGIAAGKFTSGFSGIAKSASIYAVQIYYIKDNSINARATSVISALSEVYRLRNSMNFAAVNLSAAVQTDLHSAVCDGNPDEKYRGMEAAIDRLYDAQIPVIVASGNQGQHNKTAYPSCYSKAITVGATDDLDVVEDFSNYADWLDLYAPGALIMSTVPKMPTGVSVPEDADGDGLLDSTWVGTLGSGTSFSAPHVTGAWAIMRQARPNDTLEQILVRLSIGETATDPRFTPPRTWSQRINLGLALCIGC